MRSRPLELHYTVLMGFRDVNSVKAAVLFAQSRKITDEFLAVCVCRGWTRVSLSKAKLGTIASEWCTLCRTDSVCVCVCDNLEHHFGEATVSHHAPKGREWVLG